MHLALAHPFSFLHYRSIFIPSYTRLPAASLKKTRNFASGEYSIGLRLVSELPDLLPANADR